MPPVARPRSLRPAYVGLWLAILLALSLPVQALAQSIPSQTVQSQVSRVRLLESHDDALGARLELIESAQSQISIATFIVEEDRVSLALLAHLRDAAERGVRVRLLLDASYNRLDPELQIYLQSSGIEIRQYHPFRFYRPGWITRRLHDKLMISDPGTAREGVILGGRNISEPYFGLAGRLPRPYVDRDVLVQGSSTETPTGQASLAEETQHYFDQIWHSRQTRFPRNRHQRIGKGNHEVAAVRLNKARDNLGNLFPSLAGSVAPGRAESTTEAEVIRGHQIEKVVLLTDPPGEKGRIWLCRIFRRKDPSGIGPQLLERLTGAESSVAIESPYLILSRASRRALQALRERNVRVQILTNSLASTDNLLPQAAYRNGKRRLLEMGIELYEYRGPESMHAKSAVVDDRIAIVGSFNLDPRSQDLNTEVALVFEDESLASELAASMADRRDQAWEIQPDGYPKGQDKKYPGVDQQKIVLMTLLRAVTPLFRSQL